MSCNINIYLFIAYIISGIELLDKLEKERNDLNRWLESVQTFVDTNTVVPLGDVVELEKLLETSNVSNKVLCFSIDIVSKDPTMLVHSKIQCNNINNTFNWIIGFQ